MGHQPEKPYPKNTLSMIRNFAKSCAVFVLGRETKPRRILRGLASGYEIEVSPTQNLSYLLGSFEPHLQRAIRKYVREGDTVYDIGANIGYVSLSLAKRVGPNGHVAAFEPLPQNILALRNNIKRNELSNVRVFEVAASDKRGQAAFRVAENSATASLMWHRRDPLAREFMISTVPVDELVASGDCVGNPKFVKIDVEGAEGLVLLGMQNTISSARPVVFVECSDAGREITWRVFKNLEYQCQSAITGEPITQLSGYGHSDFLWVPAN